MILAGHQPNYLPNTSYFAKMAEADVFVVSTALQLIRDKGWHRRHILPGPAGDIWLTVPVLGSHRQLIRDTRINNDLPWQARHRKTIETLYANRPGVQDLQPILALYESGWERLVDLNWAAILTIAQILNITTRVELDESVTGRQADLIINTCRHYGANRYLSGIGGREYMDSTYCEKLRSEGIVPIFVRHNLTHDYPYSVIHYIGFYGSSWVQQLIKKNIQVKSV